MRPTTVDVPMGRKVSKSTVLTPAEEAIVVEFRRRTVRRALAPFRRRNAPATSMPG
jgi:hypothetical protein